MTTHPMSDGGTSSDIMMSSRVLQLIGMYSLEYIGPQSKIRFAAAASEQGW